MTTPTNWPNPERPGYPMFPERDGWHALDTGQFIHVWHWYAKQKLWERKPNTDIAHEPKHFSHFLYKGPVLTPAQIAEMLAGERERAAKKSQEISDKYYNEREKAYHQDAREYADERMCAAHECAEAIRNLGAAP